MSGTSSTQQVPDAAVEVGDDAADGGLVLAAGVVDRPVDVLHAGYVGALLAAAERDGHGRWRRWCRG